MAPSSLETVYAGKLFRSRLEARWAVFMDAAGIEWIYEATWLETPFGNWLPDFQLTDGRWVEVKGRLSPNEHLRLLLLAQAVGGCEVGQDTVVLGHLPDDDWHWPVQLHTCKADLWAVPWVLSPGCPLAAASPRVPAERITAEVLLSGLMSGQPRWAEEPLAAARSARFG